MSVASVLGIIVSPVTDTIQKWIGRKKAKDSLKAKATMARDEQATNVTLTDAEWESIATSAQDGTWKDEFVTIVIMWPFLGIFTGTIWFAFQGDARLLDGTIAGIEALQALGVDIPFLMNAVVLAALGLKIWRKS